MGAIGNFLVLLAYSCVVLFTVRYHEKWADEAQAWLIARDLPLSRIWFYELRYEGSPGLWHTILWVAQHWFHAPYAALGYIGVAFAIAGAAVLIFKAPFPWYLRWPLAFTYVMVYQYAVIARPYTLLPLLCFLVAILFKDVEHPERMTAVLVLLAMLTLHGSILAACFGLLYLIDAIKSWRTMNDRLRNRYFICAAVMVFAFLFIFVILKPTPDVGEFAVKRALDQAPEEVKATYPTAMRKLTAVVSGAFLDFLAAVRCVSHSCRSVVLYARGTVGLRPARRLTPCSVCQSAWLSASPRHCLYCGNYRVLDRMAGER